ncbi:MAG: cytidylyltransferase domain-containing protein [Christensenellaceae bacterium]|jgi:spore coat polysaccharide biosynthesis protein SpsF
MKYLAAVQARFGSTRLPGKILMELAKKPVLTRVVQRVEKSRYINETIVLTSVNSDDIKTVNLVSGMGRRVIAGSPDDVLDRYYQAAKLLKPEYIVRITADCPVFDATLLDDAIEQMTGNEDYVSAVSETLADGLDFEIVKAEALALAWENAKMASEREHVTLYIKNHADSFRIKDYLCPFGNLNGRRWTLDEPEDYELLKSIYAHFGDVDFGTKELLAYLNEHPQLEQVNAAIGRNEGLQKSLQNDYKVEE